MAVPTCNDSTALVTGATGGIGQAIVRALHARGAQVIASGRRRECWRSSSAELGERVEPWSADLADPARGGAGCAERRRRRAGGERRAAGSGRADGFAAEEIDRALDVNLRAPMQLTRALVPGNARARQRARRLRSRPCRGSSRRRAAAIYSATKFGLRGFGFALAPGAARHGRGRDHGLPRLHPRAGHVRRQRREAAQGCRHRGPDDVAEAVIAGIEKGRAEIDVAPFSLAPARALFGLAPADGRRQPPPAASIRSPTRSPRASATSADGQGTGLIVVLAAVYVAVSSPSGRPPSGRATGCGSSSASSCRSSG